MPENDSPLIQTLLIAAVCLLTLLTLLGWRISRRLARIERWLAENSNSIGTESFHPSTAETASGGAFETFLNENPARRTLSKSEQFSEYRKWRQENGLNWSGS